MFGNFYQFKLAFAVCDWFVEFGLFWCLFRLCLDLLCWVLRGWLVTLFGWVYYAIDWFVLVLLYICCVVC